MNHILEKSPFDHLLMYENVLHRGKYHHVKNLSLQAIRFQNLYSKANKQLKTLGI